MLSMSKNLNIIIEKTGTGFSGYVQELDGIISVGDSIPETKDNILSALELKLGNLSKYQIECHVDLEQFFNYYNVINKSAFADYIGMNRSLFRQYVKGITNLSDKKLLVITDGLHRLANDFKDVNLVK